MRSAVFAVALAGVASAALSTDGAVRRNMRNSPSVFNGFLNIADQISPLNSWGLATRQDGSGNGCVNANWIPCDNIPGRCHSQDTVCCPETNTTCPVNFDCVTNGTNSGCCGNPNLENCFLGDGKPIGLNGAVSKNVDIRYDVNLFEDWWNLNWNCDGSTRALYTNTTAHATILFDNTVAGFVIFAGADKGAEYRLNITNQIDRVVFEHDNNGCNPNYKFTYNTKSFNWLTLSWLPPSNQYAGADRNPGIQLGRITLYANAEDIAKVQLGDPSTQTGSLQTPTAATAVGVGGGASTPAGAGAETSGTAGHGASASASAQPKPSAADSRVAAHSTAAVCAIILAGLWLSA